MNASTLIQKLRKEIASIAGDNLPAEIRYQDRYGNVVIKPLFDVTLDELAFAAQTLNAERSTLSRRQVALEDVYAHARKQGFLGADLMNAALALTQVPAQLAAVVNGWGLPPLVVVSVER